MENYVGALGEYFDVAQLALYIFWLFFAGLIIYLQLEGRREGFPTVSPLTGEKNMNFTPSPKQFVRHDGSIAIAPDPNRKEPEIKAEQFMSFAGAPIVPVGDPLSSGVGPSAISMRADVPDVTFEGHARLVPMRTKPEFSIAEEDVNIVGLDIYGTDGEVAGKVSDVWVDLSEYVIRYLEIDLAGDADAASEAGTVLFPWNMAQLKNVPGPVEYFVPSLDNGERWIKTDAVTAEQFRNAPRTKNPERVTLLEEEMIQGYFGGGYLYAEPGRAEPLV